VSATDIPDVSVLLARAAAAHRAALIEPGRALVCALDAGGALTAAKALVPRGGWTPALASIGIPASTARLYMLLAAHRARIEEAGCTSIRQARSLITAHRRTTDSESKAGRRSSYEEGYKSGYAKGKRDGGNPTSNGATVPPSKADIKWMLRRMHPDVVDEKDKERAHRAAVWLNAIKDSNTREANE
jgi:hypothetical protein